MISKRQRPSKAEAQTFRNISSLAFYSRLSLLFWQMADSGGLPQLTQVTTLLIKQADR